MANYWWNAKQPTPARLAPQQQAGSGYYTSPQPSQPAQPDANTWQPGGVAGGYTPAPAPSTPPAQNPSSGGGSGGSGGGGSTGGQSGGADLGPFSSVQQWESQFAQEHGRAPTQDDFNDFQDSVNFYNQTGRGPTQREWYNRWRYGVWNPTFGGGGGGGGGGGAGGQQQQGYPQDMGLYYWNVR